MTNKSIRDYINLIENLQREGVAEGLESGAKILYTGKDKSGTVTISYEPDYIPGHSEKYIIRFDGKVKSEMPTLKSAVYGLMHYQFDTFRPNLQPNPKTVLEQGVAEGSYDDDDTSMSEKLHDLLQQGMDYKQAVNLVAKTYNTYPEYVVGTYNRWGNHNHDPYDDFGEQGVTEGSESDAYGNTGEKHECGSCDGTGIDTYNDECPECGGKGWVRDKEE